MAAKGAAGLRRILLATGYSVRGLSAAFRGEAAFRQELLLLAIAAPLAWWLEPGAIGRALLIGSVVLVLVVELLNSAIEAAIDRFGEERHPLSGRAKDLGSAAVMVALLNAGLVWVLVLTR